MPGIKRKPVLFTYKAVKEGILSISNPMDRFLFAVSYANGTRVSEALSIKASGIEANKEFVYITTPVLKKRFRQLTYRAPPISRSGEEWLADLLLGYIKGRTGNLITFSKRTAQRRFNQYFECTSHSFRHTRATHCITVLGMSMRMIAEYFKISPMALSDWVMRYGYLDRRDLETHLGKRFEK